MTDFESSPLAMPLDIGTLTIPGRLVKAATAETRFDHDGYATDELLELYEPMVAAGTPLIVTGNLYVHSSGKSTPRMGGIDHDDKISGLSELTAMARANGVRVFAQLNHCGRQTLPRALGRDEAVSASAVREKLLGTKPRPMTAAEIDQTVVAFADAAVRARESGFDGVEVHMAHGYLLGQFLTPYTNRRSDRFGGSAAARMRVPLQVIRSIRRRVGDDFPVMVRLNGHDLLAGRAGLDTAELVGIAGVLADCGVDAVDLTAGHYESGLGMMRGRFDGFFSAMLDEGAGAHLPRWRQALMRVGAPAAEWASARMWGPPSEGWNLRYSRHFTAALDIPVICVGGFHTRAAMEAAVSGGACDAVAVGRAMIADPMLWRHLREGLEAPQCDYCNGCIARAGGMPADCYNDEVRRQRGLTRIELASTADAAYAGPTSGPGRSRVVRPAGSTR